MGLLENLSGLPVYGKDDRPGAGHELKHFGWNHGLENVIFLEQDHAGIRCSDVGRDVDPRLLIDESYIFKSVGTGFADDTFFVGSLPYQEKKYVRRPGLQVLRGFDECVQSMSHSHGSDVADHKFIREFQFPSQIPVALLRSK